MERYSEYAILFEAPFGSIAYAHPDFAETFAFSPQDFLKRTSAKNDDLLLAPISGKDGGLWQASCVPLGIPGGPDGRLWLFRALEEEKGDDRTRARFAQVAKLKALGEMAGGVAHEINNPLAIIAARAAFLKDRAAKGAMNDALAIEVADRIIAVVDRISRVVKGLRSFAREGQEDPPASVYVRELVEDTLSFCRERMKNHGVDLRVGPIPEEATVVCRPIPISQVLLNLLNNAFDAASEAASVETGRWIEVSVAEEADGLEIRVTDGGPGVPAPIRQRIFEPFFTTKETSRGTGLGLSISREIMDGHGGSLALDPGCANTRFVARLPRTGEE